MILVGGGLVVSLAFQVWIPLKSTVVYVKLVRKERKNTKREREWHIIYNLHWRDNNLTVKRTF